MSFSLTSVINTINTILLTKPTWTQITAQRNLTQAMALFVSPVVPLVPPAPPAPRPAAATQKVPNDATGKQTLVCKRVADMNVAMSQKGERSLDMLR